MARERILVIEDEADLREVLAYNLSREGFQVDAAGDGARGLSKAEERRPDLILLDLMLPDMDGLEVCRRLRQDRELSDTPIIMVTAKGEGTDIVVGLGVGADDYLCKPFSIQELVARVRAVLRRGAHGRDDEERRKLRRGPIEIDPSRHEVLVNGQAVKFTATEFRMLHFLALRPGRVYERDSLLRHVLGDEDYRVERNIDVHIRSIRKKLGEQRDVIETVRGVGYNFSDRL